MPSIFYLLLVAVLAERFRRRWSVLDSFEGLPGYLFSLGVTLFLVCWVNFGLYFVLGWGLGYVIGIWAIPVACLAWDWRLGSAGAGPSSMGTRWWLPPGERFAFLFVLALVGGRFATGFYLAGDGNIWSNFNFVDTAFHLSVVNALLEAPRFPPIDLDMAPYPLKYHFIGDFFVAHLSRIGASLLPALWGMNVLSSAVLAGSLWAVFRRWLRLPPAWILLATLLFLFLNTALVNFVHFLALSPSFFRSGEPMNGVLLYPYFNFEALLTNLFEPQRGLLFSFPVLLLILHISGGKGRIALDKDPASTESATLVPVLAAFWFVCLMPFSHIVGFAVMALALLPALWVVRGGFFVRWRWWLPALVIGLAQLFYIEYYGPPLHPEFSGWDEEVIPLNDFKRFPEWSRRAVFWFFANGDFLAWGGLFIGVALIAGCWRGRLPEGVRALCAFVREWAWFLAVCAAFFGLINFYRYSFAWGDSNKFVLFLNLALAMVITMGAAMGRQGRARGFSRLLWGFFFTLCVAPAIYEIGRDLVIHAPGKHLLFHRNEIEAAGWLRANRKPDELVLTAAYNLFHFVTPLAGAPTRAGIYGDSNPHRRPGRRENIRRIYEEYDLAALRRLPVRYICISRGERRRYTLHPEWTRNLENGASVVFQSGAPGEHDSAFLIDCSRLFSSGNGNSAK